MTDRTISPLCRRMIEDMTVRGFTPKTQTGYIRAVRDFTAFFGLCLANSYYVYKSPLFHRLVDPGGNGAIWVHA